MDIKFEQRTVTSYPGLHYETIQVPFWAKSIQISTSGKYKFIMENSEGKHFNTAIIPPNGSASLYKSYLPSDAKFISFLSMEPNHSFDIYVVFNNIGVENA
jgi:hypothetical protein